MPIKYFEILGEVIQGDIDHMTSRTGKQRPDMYQEIVTHLINMESEWFSELQPNIPYGDSMCRIAYLYAHAPINSNLIGYIILSDAEFRNYLIAINQEKGIVDICAFGGGPGSELLGISKSISGLGLPTPLHLRFLLTDIVSDWFYSWNAIEQSVEKRQRTDYGIDRSKWPLITQGSVHPVDVRNISHFNKTRGVFIRDAYILNYLISEIVDDFARFLKFMLEVNTIAPVGAKYLFIDRNRPEEKDKVIKVAYALGLSLSEIHETNVIMDLDEQRSDLGQLYLDLHASGRDPRTKWNAFWVVGTKV